MLARPDDERIDYNCLCSLVLGGCSLERAIQ